MTQTRPYGGRTLDERRDARREQLIETGLDCLHRAGLSGISVRTVCTEARLTPRYFYENFANLDELLVALVDHVGDEVSKNALAALLENDDIAEQVRQGLAAVFAVVLSDPRKASVVLAATGHEAMQARQQQRFLGYVEIVVQNLTGAQMAEVDQSRLRPMALFLIGGAVELISAKLSGLIELADAEVVDRCADLFLAGWQAAGVAVPQTR